jgi:hypothetical protein
MFSFMNVEGLHFTLCCHDENLKCGVSASYDITGCWLGLENLCSSSVANIREIITTVASGSTFTTFLAASQSE